MLFCRRLARRRLSAEHDILQTADENAAGDLGVQYRRTILSRKTAKRVGEEGDDDDVSKARPTDRDSCTISNLRARPAAVMKESGEYSKDTVIHSTRCTLRVCQVGTSLHLVAVYNELKTDQYEPYTVRQGFHRQLSLSSGETVLLVQHLFPNPVVALSLQTQLDAPPRYMQRDFTFEKYMFKGEGIKERHNSKAARDDASVENAGPRFVKLIDPRTATRL